MARNRLAAASVTRRTIVQVADYGGPYSGSFIPSLLRLSAFVRDRLDFDSVFAFSEVARSRPWLQAVRDAGIPVAFISRRSSHFDRARRLAILTKKHRGALLHSHFSAFDLGAALAARWQRVRVVWHVHSLFAEEFKGAEWKDFVRWRLFGEFLVDGIIPVSDAVAKNVLSRGAPAARVHVVRNGIDVARFRSHMPLDRSASTNRYGIPTDTRVGLLFGWSPQVKGVDVLVDAALQLASSQASEIHFLIVRGERNEDQLKEMTRGVPNVHVIAPVENVAGLYRIADFFVSASRSEGFPFAIGEAMASGLPIVSSDIPAVQACYGRAGDGVVFFRSGSSQNLAQAVDRLLDLPTSERRRMGMTNQRFVEENLSLDQWCEGVGELYGTILSKSEA